jgi:SAM-dependent methyltransferase
MTEQSASFDVVYSSNALDHTRSPRRCIEQMTAVLRPGGWLVLEGFLREGSNGNWVGLHQHDLFPANGTLVHLDRAGRRTDLTSGLPLACVSERVSVFRDRDIEAFGCEVPPDMPPDAPWDWRRRDWHTMVFRRTQD